MILDRLSLSGIMLAAGGGLILSLWLGRSKFEAHLISRTLSWPQFTNVLEISFITLVGRMLVLAAFIISASLLVPGIDYWHLFAAAAITSFAANLPLTIHGWGLRELTAVYTLGQLGVPSSEALAVSILIGMCSTAVILVAMPLALKKTGGPDITRSVSMANAGSGGFEIEKAAVWIIVTAAAVLIFFQVHVPLAGGIINVNLADPFAILALAATVAHAVSVRQLPHWRVAEFNWILAVFSALLVFAFLRGTLEIGVTQWAFAGRVTGWLMLLGYLSIGYLTVSYMGSHGLRRFAETMVSTAVIVVIVHATMRWLDHSGLVSGLDMPSHFEGYAANRNAFAFQLLVCSTMLLAYSSLFRRADRHALSLIAASCVDDVSNKSSAACRVVYCPRLWLFSLLHGLILVGLVFSASRAGLIAGSILLATAWVARLADRRMIALSMVFAIAIWLIPQLGLGGGGIQGPSSGATSDPERWETYIRGSEMWLNSPFFGAGLGVFIERSTEWFNRPLNIHSTPLWMLAELGLLGMGVFLWGLLKLGRFLYNTGLGSPAHRVIAMLLLVFMIFSLVHEIFYQRILKMLL